MCGIKPCASCSRKKKRGASVGAKRKRTMKKNAIVKTAKEGLTGVVGLAIGGYLNNVPIVGNNAALGAGIKIVVASMLTGRKSTALTKGIATGLAIGGMRDLVGAVAPGLASSAGIAGIGYNAPFSTSNPGVAGGKIYLQ